MLLIILIVGLFTAAKYSYAGIYLNGLTAGSRGLGFKEQDSNAAVARVSASDKSLEKEIERKSLTFINAAFNHDEETVAGMLTKDAEYVLASGGAGFIRYIAGSQHVEGYMATDKELVGAFQKWCITEKNGTVVSCMSVRIKGIKDPQRWYIHYIKAWGKWKIYMLENGL